MAAGSFYALLVDCVQRIGRLSVTHAIVRVFQVLRLPAYGLLLRLKCWENLFATNTKAHLDAQPDGNKLGLDADDANHQVQTFVGLDNGDDIRNLVDECGAWRALHDR